MKHKRVSRRKFLKSLSGGAAFLALGPLAKAVRSNPLALGPRVRVPNPYVTSEGKPILVCVKGTDFRQMLRRGLEELGGLNKLINSNQDILIKPNLNATEPYPGISKVDSIVEMIEAVKEVSTGVIKVGDQGYNSSDEVYPYLNLEEAVTNAGGVLLNLSSSYRVRRETWNPAKPDFFVYTDIYDAPIIINLHCLKRHSWAYLTCSLKNNVGAIIGPYAQQTRNYLHSLPAKSTPFLLEVAEIAGLINPELNIVDARSILTVNGPFVGTGVVKDIHRLIICGDMVATDAYCAQLMARYDSTFSASRIAPTLQHAEALGLGTADLSKVEIIERTLMRGDTDDDGNIDISDISYSIDHLFKNGPPPFPKQALDVNCDDKTDIKDIVYLINHVLKGGLPPC